MLLTTTYSWENVSLGSIIVASQDLNSPKILFLTNITLLDVPDVMMDTSLMTLEDARNVTSNAYDVQGMTNAQLAMVTKSF